MNVRRALIATSLVIWLTAVLPGSAVAKGTRGFFGVAPADVPTASEFQRMARGGITNVRFLVHWPSVQPNEGGAYDWSQTDAIVVNAATSGISLLPFLYGTPRWAADCSGATECERTNPVRTAKGRAGWSAFVSAAVARYGPRGTLWSDTTDAYWPPFLPIRRWQIWNEANAANFYQPRPSPRDYLQLLRLSRNAIRSKDPAAGIELAGLFGTPPKPGISMWRFLERLYALKGARGLFDTVAIHPYSPGLRGITYQLQRARETMDDAGDRKKPILITELGWGSASPAASQPLNKGLNGQAHLLKKSFKLLRQSRKRYRLRQVFWFTWHDVSQDSSGRCTFCESAGLLDSSLAPKPAWTAFTRFAGGTP